MLPDKKEISNQYQVSVDQEKVGTKKRNKLHKTGCTITYKLANIVEYFKIKIIFFKQESSSYNPGYNNHWCYVWSKDDYHLQW